MDGAAAVRGENTTSAGFYILAAVSKERLCKYCLPTDVQIHKNPTEEKGEEMIYSLLS